MVIDNLYLRGTVRSPTEADTISVVDPDAVLPLPVGDQRFETVSGWNSEVPKSLGRIEMFKLPPGDRPQLPGTRFPGGPRVPPVKHVFGASVGE